MRSLTCSRAVKIRIATRLPSRRRRRQTSRPSMPGRPMSSTTASGTFCTTISIARSPSSAVCTSYPPRVSARRNASRTARSSSTTKILMVSILTCPAALAENSYIRLIRLIACTSAAPQSCAPDQFDFVSSASPPLGPARCVRHTVTRKGACMSTPEISAPPRAPSRLDRLLARARSGLRRLARGREADPAWSRPLLWLVAVLAGALTFWGLTRNGYANTYYAEAAQAASHSWRAWLTNAVDTSGSDSLDKGPLSNMLMGLSGRLFGFSAFTMLAPEALCGIGAVLLLHNTVKRTLGHREALLAALMLALTPIFVAMSRFNNPDALLVLLEVAAAWALVRGLQSGRTRDVLLCGVFVGLAFNVKMLQAYLIVPGLALTLLIAGQGTIRRRLAQLFAGGAAMFFVSFVWYTTMMLIPATDRPWVGDTTDNSWFSLIFGANGLSRVSGESSGPGGGANFG